MTRAELMQATLIALSTPPRRVEPVAAYLTFSSESEFTLNVYDSAKHWNGTLEYSTDAQNWTEWDGTTTLSSSGGILNLRGTGNTVITGGDLFSRWKFTGTRISCTGNIENLLDYATVAGGAHPAMQAFCYYYMFYGCTSLTSAPALPATTLSNSCYSHMFYGCSSLTSAPALPATTLSNYCYSSMFQGCTSLTSAPALPATTLMSSCYSDMFRGCTSLTSAPALPATTLSDHCYYSMFAYCASLKLSSTQTGGYSYAYRIPSSGTGIAAGDSLTRMFNNTGGTFTGTPTINTTYYTTNPPV